MTTQSEPAGSPWYRNFWPWFLVILMGVSVLASLGTVVVAYRYADVDVRHHDRIDRAVLAPATSADEVDLLTPNPARGN